MIMNEEYVKRNQRNSDHNQHQTVLEKDEAENMQKHEYYKDERYHHGAAMGQKNVKVCRSLQQFGDEKPVNVTVCRDFHRLSIPASGIRIFSPELSEFRAFLQAR